MLISLMKMKIALVRLMNFAAMMERASVTTWHVMDSQTVKIPLMKVKVAVVNPTNINGS